MQQLAGKTEVASWGFYIDRAAGGDWDHCDPGELDVASDGGCKGAGEDDNVH